MWCNVLLFFFVLLNTGLCSACQHREQGKFDGHCMDISRKAETLAEPCRNLIGEIDDHHHQHTQDLFSDVQHIYFCVMCMYYFVSQGKCVHTPYSIQVTDNPLSIFDVSSFSPKKQAQE